MNWLLIRGFTRDSRHWEGFPKQFGTRLGSHVETIDPPGFGTQSDRTSPASIAAITDDIRSRFDRTDEEWSILGISLGGMVALDWCARYPGDFHRCVVINSNSTATPWYRQKASLVPLAVGRRFRSDEAHERAVLALSSNNPESARLAPAWATYLAKARPAEKSVVNQARAGLGFHLPQRLSIPLLVLASRADRIASYHASELIAERLNGDLRLHDSAGHDLPLDDPAWVGDSVAQWIHHEQNI